MKEKSCRIENIGRMLMTNICIIKYLGERNNGKERRKSIELEHYLNRMKDINQNIPDGSIQHIKKRDNF